MGREPPGADGGGGDDLTVMGAAVPDGHMEQDPYETLVETNKKIADLKNELRRLRSLKREQGAGLSLAGRSDKELDILMFQAKELSADIQETIQETKEELAELKSTRDNLTQLLIATRPMQMLLRESGRFREQSKERSPALMLQTKPLYDPAGSETPINLDPLVVSAWHYFVLGYALMAPVKMDQAMKDAVEQAMKDAVEQHTQGTAVDVEPEVDYLRDVRHVGLIAGSSGVGKTHLGLEAWHYRDKLDQPRFVKAAADAGVSEAKWAHVCAVAQDMRVCCINFGGGSAWGPVDEALVKLSPWYRAACSDDGDKRVPGAEAKQPSAAQAKQPPGAPAVPPSASQANPPPTDQTDSPRTVQGDVSPRAQVVPDAHLLPLYLRVLWGLMPQVDMSYDSFSDMALTQLRLGHIEAWSIMAEAKQALSACRPAFIVDKLNLAVMQPGDRRLAEVYRHRICQTAAVAQASVVFLSPSFEFVDDEIMSRDQPWNLVVVGQLVRKSVSEIKENLLPVASRRRVVFTPRSFHGSNLAKAEDVAEAFANLSGGHMRSYACLRDELDCCPPNVTLWSVVEDALVATGLMPSVRKLLRHLVFFPGLLAAGLLPCTVQGAARLPMVGLGAPPVGFSVTFDDAISHNLLYGSPDVGGVYEDPSLPPLVIMGLSKEWENALAEMETEAMDYHVSPVVRNILRACSRVLSAADVADPDRGWEVTCYWAEVMMSHVRHGAERFLMGAPGVSGVQDFSRVSLKNLYKGVDSLEQQPVRHPLLSDVLVDATRPLVLKDEIPELITKYRDVHQVLQMSPEVLLSQPFMMADAHPSFDMIRFLPVVDDPRPQAESSDRTNGMIAVCISCMSTTDADLTVPLNLVADAEGLLHKAFGDKNWDSWQHNVIHVTICNHRGMNDPATFLDDVRAAERIVVVGRDDFESIYGLGLGGVMSSAPMLHGANVVR